ncbi:MAG: PTS fructose transporter subunit IIA [Nitrospirae bacterium GWC2_56_14]|nr:MAG: PTS fructose transporter subunit IIA [Nitrospirae bacterium GWC2_56_14]
MATLKDLLQGGLIIADIKAIDKVGVIREFAAHVCAAGKVRDADELARVLLERESMGSTGIGDGVAIPHGKLRTLGEVIVAFGRSHRGVDYQSLDDKSAYLFFLLVSPENSPGEHLKMLARISRILKNPALREKLRAEPDGRELHRLILEEDSKYPQK